MALDPLRRREYQDLFNSCETTPSKMADVQSIVGRILGKKDRYQAVEDKTQVPWFVVAVIHSLEGDLNFSTHLHSDGKENPELVKPGMLFIMSTGGGNGHTGIVEKVIGGRLVTIEGNTSDAGSREGIGVFRRDARKIASINKGFIDYGSA
jgi:hypothetical protein